MSFYNLMKLKPSPLFFSLKPFIVNNCRYFFYRNKFKFILGAVGDKTPLKGFFFFFYTFKECFFNYVIDVNYF